MRIWAITFLAVSTFAIAPEANAANKVAIVGPATAKPDLPGSIALAYSKAEIVSVRWLVCRESCVERPGIVDPFDTGEQIFGYRVKKANVGALLRVEATFADSTKATSSGVRIKRPKRIKTLPTARARELVDRAMKKSRLRADWRSSFDIASCSRRDRHQIRCRFSGVAGDTEYGGFAEIARVGNVYTGSFSDSVYAEVQVTNGYCVDTGGTDCTKTYTITSPEPPSKRS